MSEAYKIIMDGCGEFLPGMDAARIPMYIRIGNEMIRDDAYGNEKLFAKIASTRETIRSSCPSPEDWMEEMEAAARAGCRHIYAVTVSSGVSGSHMSAMVARDLFEGIHPDVKIYPVDSKTASIGQTLVAMKITHMENKGMKPDTINKKIKDYIGDMHTYSVLDHLDMLRKNGRISGMKAAAANVLNIKPVLASNEDGQIVQVSQGRGIKPTLRKMLETMVKEAGDTKRRALGIVHCGCPERAEWVKKEVKKMADFDKIITTEADGASSVYLDRGGIMVSI